MAEPVGCSLRAARRSGLTSPGTGPHLRRPRWPPRTPSPSQEPRTSRTAGERQDARARDHIAKLLMQESSRNELPELVGGSRLSVRLSPRGAQRIRRVHQAARVLPPLA